MKNQIQGWTVGKQIVFALAGCLIFGAMFIFIELMRAPSPGWDGVRMAFVLLGIYGVLMVALNVAIFSAIGRWNRRPELTARLVIEAIAGFLTSAILTTWIGGHLITFIYPQINVLSLQHYVQIAFYSLLFGFPMFLYMAVREFWQRALEKVKEKELTQERLEKELLAARLQALQAQTNPHFLFNALNSIAGLIATDPVRAEATVERLASLFRYALDRHDGRLVLLSEEVRVVEDYLTIEKTRFGERLRCSLLVPERLSDVRLPPLLLQPLVENAVKHGVGRREDETEVNVRAEMSGNSRLRLTVENEGPAPAAEAEWRGVGLDNLQKRCRALYGDDFSFRLEQSRPGWTVAELEIPCEACSERSDVSNQAASARN